MKSITQRLVVGLFFTVFIISTIAVATMYLFISWESNRSLKRKSDDSINYLVGALKVPLWSFDTSQVNIIVKTMFQDTSVAKISIKDEYGTEIYSVEKKNQNVYITHSGKIYYKDINIGEVFSLSFRDLLPIGQQSITPGIDTCNNFNSYLYLRCFQHTYSHFIKSTTEPTQKNCNGICFR